tara:strand:+ start:540 stop:878 length:339 start_codon:yes stop_codon:yes gene_type:complete
MFDTFDALQDWMDGRPDITNVAEFLRISVDEEAKVLLDYEIETGVRARRCKSALQANRRDAEEHFLEEINEFLQEDTDLTHWTVMSYRRKPKAWAVARAILMEMKRCKTPKS